MRASKVSRRRAFRGLALKSLCPPIFKGVKVKRDIFVLGISWMHETF